MMKKLSIKRLILSTVLLMTLTLAANPDVDYKAKYERQVYNNEILQNKITSQEMIIDDKTKTISEQNQEIEKQKIREQERMLFVIPFTQVGVSKDEVKGAAFAVLAVEVHPLFLIGFLF